MKKRYNIYILLTCVMLFASSCQEEIIDEFTPDAERWESIDDFIESTDATKKVSIVNASEEFVLETEHAVVRFPAETIMNPLTGALAEGQIELSYLELDTYNDLFFENVDGEAIDGETLYSRYIIKVELNQGNIPLQINSNKPPVIHIETDIELTDNERVFTWTEVNGKLGWFINGNIDVETDNWDFTVEGNQYKGSGLKMYLRETGYSTIAEQEILVHPMMSDYSTVSLQVDQSFQTTQTKIFIARHGDFSLIPINLINGQYINTMIKNEEPVTAIGITVRDEKLYFAKRSFIVGETNDHNMIFNETSFIEVIEELRRL